MLSHEEQQKILGGILKRKENLHCAQCGSKSPCWASLEFGVLICLDCSGAHRALGPSVTRVKSTRLDSWNKDWLSCIEAGNTTANAYWEYEIPAGDHSKKPNQNSSIDFRIRYVKDKYIRQLYINPRQTLKEIKQRIAALQSKNTRGPSKGKDVPSNKQGSSCKVPKKTPALEVNPGKQANNTADFSFFDDMMKPKVKPANQNLIDQEEEKPKVNLKKPSTSFADFNLLEMPRPKKEEKEKINKQQFMSMGGVPPLNRPKTKAPIDFDLFHHGIEKANLEGDKKQGNSSNLISFENDQNQKLPGKSVFQQYGFNSNNIQPDKSNYATMNGGLNFSNNQLLQSKPSSKMPSALTLPSFAQSWETTGGFPGKKPPEGSQAKMEISLEATIDLSKGERCQKGPKSWVDEWK